jgi:hypothetical protein
MTSLLAEQAKELAKEMSALSKMQSFAIETAIYIKMSREELLQYDKRRERISEICSVLSKYRPTESATT